MMSDTTPTNVPAGWYPDPTDASWQRWWDGTGWTEHAVPAASVTPELHASAHSQAAYQPTAYPQAPAAPTAPLRSDIETNTVWIWLVVLLPLVMLPTIFLIDWRGYLESSLATSTLDSANPVGPSVGMTLASLGLSALGYVVAGVGILFAWLDWRELKRRGIQKPFHWAWAFLALVVTNGVYVIGRGVILRRQTGKGLGPVWAWIAVTALSLIVGVVYASMIMGEVFDLILEQAGDIPLS
jgi:hypothetical protein